MKKKLLLAWMLAVMALLFSVAGATQLGPIGQTDTTPEGADPIDSVFDETQEDTQAIGILEALMGDRAETVDIVVLLTILSILPSALLMLTAFTRIIITLSFIRNAIGTQQMPPNQVLVGLALFLTFFVMAPVFERVKVEAYDPYIAEEINVEVAIERAMVPIREYMMRNTHERDLRVFANYANIAEIDVLEDIPTHLLIPAFITSEIKLAFSMGFLLYIPFIVIDMVVSSVLMSMGMMMLPPATISLPFKILLFVMVDGWMLTVQMLMDTIHTFT